MFFREILADARRVDGVPVDLLARVQVDQGAEQLADPAAHPAG